MSNKGLYRQSYAFSSSHIWMRELFRKESWMLKTWYFSTVVLEKTLESPLDWKEIKPVHPKGNQIWIVIGRTDAKAEAPVLWPPDVKSQKRLWCWERLKAGGEGYDRGPGGWVASLTRWTWVWSNSGRRWGTEAPGKLQSMGFQRAGHNRATATSDI